MRYSYVNFINSSTLISTSTEDALYLKEYLYDNRPSRPFRFTSKTAQNILIDLSATRRVSLACLFNHNLTPAAEIRLQANGSNAWGAPALNLRLNWRELDLYRRLNSQNRWLRYTIDDPTNIAFPEIGLAWLGEWNKLPGVRVSPGRSDSPNFITTEQETAFGQDWDIYLSEAQKFELSLTELFDPATLSAFHAFLRAIQGSAGRFVFIPDDREPHVYFVKVAGSPTSQRMIYGPGSKELKSWSLSLKVLTRGISLL
jgi:hypothetical protein